MRIIIDNDYSRHNFTRVTKKEKQRRRGKRIFILLFVPIFEVEFIARYILTRNHDNIMLSIYVYSTPNDLM